MIEHPSWRNKWHKGIRTIGSVNVSKSARRNKTKNPTGVNVRMLLHVALLVESLAAVLAWIWPRVAVYEEMCGEG